MSEVFCLPSEEGPAQKGKTMLPEGQPILSF